ncbi:MAG: ATP-binding protein [Pararhodobacter sp.]|nr:ATP-binding protein [Pararhodobacter sp.]
MDLPASNAQAAPGVQAGTARHRLFEEQVRIRRCFPAGAMETRAALLAISDSLRCKGLTEDDLSSAELILAEVLNNIVEHAYANTEGQVDLCIDLRANGLYCEVRDHGGSMPNGQAPNPALPAINPPQDLPEGGFGWHIIRSLTTQLGYRQENGWNALSFVVPLTWMD